MLPNCQQEIFHVHEGTIANIWLPDKYLSAADEQIVAKAVAYHAQMGEREVKDTLAINMAALMASSSTLKSQNALAKRSCVAQTTISNYLDPSRYTGFPSLDKLVRISSAFKLPVWALLLPGLDPKHPPVVLKREQRAEYEVMRAVYQQVLNAARGADESIRSAGDPPNSEDASSQQKGAMPPRK